MSDTEVPWGVYLSSGSRVNRPIRNTLLKFDMFYPPLPILGASHRLLPPGRRLRLRCSLPGLLGKCGRFARRRGRGLPLPEPTASAVAEVPAFVAVVLEGQFGGWSGDLPVLPALHLAVQSALLDDQQSQNPFREPGIVLDLPDRLPRRIEIRQVIGALLGALDVVRQLPLGPLFGVNKLRPVLLQDLMDVSLDGRPILGSQVSIDEEHAFVQLCLIHLLQPFFRVPAPGHCREGPRARPPRESKHPSSR